MWALVLETWRRGQSHKRVWCRAGNSLVCLLDCSGPSSTGLVLACQHFKTGLPL